MAREVSVKIDGTTYLMPVNFAAWKRISENVADPLQVAMKAATGEPFNPTAGQIISILWYGISASGSDITEEQLGDLIFDTCGIAEMVEPSIKYFTAFVEGKPDKPIRSKKKTKKKAKKS